MKDEQAEQRQAAQSPQGPVREVDRLRDRLRRRWRPRPDDRNEFPYSLDELLERLKTADADLAADILEEARETSERMVEGRVEGVERRAATLQGVVAIAATFVLTGGTLLVSQIDGVMWRSVTGVLLLGCVGSFALCGLRATQAASHWQEWSIPAREGIFNRPEDGVVLGRLVRAASILRSAGKNSSRARLKVTLLRMAVWHLQNAMVLLVVLAAMLVAYAISSGNSSNERVAAPAEPSRAHPQAQPKPVPAASKSRHRSGHRRDP